MTGPGGSEENHQGAPAPLSQPPSDEPTTHAGWEPPASWEPPAGWEPPAAYAQTFPPPEPQTFSEIPQYQQYPSTGEQPGSQPTQYGTAPQYSPLGQYPPSEPAFGQQPTQFGEQPTQFGQPTGQFGEPGLYAPPGADSGSSKRSLAVLSAVIGVLLAIIVAVVAVMGFWKPGFFITTKLDINKAQQGVQDILSNDNTGYGLKDVHNVKCNGGENPTVKNGGTFTCEVTIGNNLQKLTVKFVDDKGTYEVGRPQ